MKTKTDLLRQAAGLVLLSIVLSMMVSCGVQLCHIAPQGTQEAR